MRYKQITRYTGDLIETILNGREIENINLFLSPDNSSDTDVDMITNINKGIELIHNNINNKILILVDSDMDGFSSAAIMYKYLKMINRYANIDYYVHDKKTHGLTDEVMEYVKDNQFDLIIIPDAGSNDVIQIETLETAYKTKVLVIDHHEIEVESEYGVIINNQMCEYTNKNLTGAGMSYLFCKALDKRYNTGRLEELSNLALIGQVGDVSDLKDNEVRNLCMKSISNIEHGLLQAYYKDKDIYDLTIKDLSFGIIPMVNAITRVGSLEARKILFEALADIDLNRNFIFPKRKLNKELGKYEVRNIEMNLYECAIDMGKEAKKRQDKIVKEYALKLEEQYNPKSGIQIFINEFNAEGIGGLVATKLSNQYQQPVIILTEKNGIYGGSIRGNIKVFDDFKAWCLSTGLFEMVIGHSNAAGCEITKDNLERLRELALNIESREICYDVDMIYKDNINSQDIFLLDKYKRLWYGGVNPPKFAVENIKVPKAWLNYSRKTLRFYIGGVGYVKFGVSEEEYNKLKMTGFNENIIFNIVGGTDINRWNGKETAQFLIDDYEVVEDDHVSIYGIFA